MASNMINDQRHPHISNERELQNGDQIWMVLDFAEAYFLKQFMVS